VQEDHGGVARGGVRRNVSTGHFPIHHNSVERLARTAERALAGVASQRGDVRRLHGD